MCYAIPGKVVELDKNKAVIDYFGEKRSVLNEISLNIGDYVYAQAGVVIQRVDSNIAVPILENWKEDFIKLKKIDEDLAIIDEIKINDNEISKILKKSEFSMINKDEALKLLKISDKDELSLLIKTANKIRTYYIK